MPRRWTRGGVTRVQSREEGVAIIDAQKCTLAPAAEHQGPGSVRLPLCEDGGGERGVALEVVERVGGVDEPRDPEEWVVLRGSGLEAW